MIPVQKLAFFEARQGPGSTTQTTHNSSHEAHSSHTWTTDGIDLPLALRKG